jgi:hypothetical protein
MKAKVTVTQEMIDMIDQIESVEVSTKQKDAPDLKSVSFLIYKILKKFEKASNGGVIAKMQETYKIKVYHSQVIRVRESYIDKEIK